MKEKEYERYMALQNLLNGIKNENIMTKEEVKEIAYIAWKGAANTHRMYPDNKHTFTEYWSGAESQFDKFCKADVIKSVCAMCEQEKELKSENLCKECFDSLP